MLITQTQPKFCLPGHRICRCERRARPLAEFLDINPAAEKPLKRFYNQCFECVDRGYLYSQGQPQIPLAVRRGLSREHEAREAKIRGQRCEASAAAPD